MKFWTVLSEKLNFERSLPPFPPKDQASQIRLEQDELQQISEESEENLLTILWRGKTKWGTKLSLLKETRYLQVKFRN